MCVEGRVCIEPGRNPESSLTERNKESLSDFVSMFLVSHPVFTAFAVSAVLGASGAMETLNLHCSSCGSPGLAVSKFSSMDPA